MKKYYLFGYLFFSAFTLFSNFCSGQLNHYSDSLKKNIIKINPWGIYLGSYNIQYERIFHFNNSVELLLNYKYNTRNSFFQHRNNFPDLKNLAKEYSFLLDYRHYTINHTKKDRTYYTYFSPFFKFTSLSFTATDIDYYYELKVISYKAGMDWGFQKVIKKRIVLDIFGGPFLRFTNDIYGQNRYYNMPWENDTYTFYIINRNNSEKKIDGVGLGFRIGINIGYSFGK